MKVGIPREVHPEEHRVAVVPVTLARLIKAGFEVIVETTAGDRADAHDAKYVEMGAVIAPDAGAVWAQADIVLKVLPPTAAEIAQLRSATTLISFIQPADDGDRVQALAATGASVIGLDQVPRISRAQKLDALSAMANIAGYRAIIEAAQHFGRFFAGQMTAAGKVPPAKVLVIGGGVAGLAAIAAAKGLGAIVRAFDTRLAVKEQVESLGAEFLMLDFEESGEGDGGYAKVMSDTFLDAERKLFAEQAIDVDIIVTTANIPGREAPKLITSGMVESMSEGSVIVDLAAERGGNCQMTKPGEIIRHHGVTIIGITDMPARMPALSSRLLGNVHAAMLDEMGGGEQFTIDLDNEVVRGALITHGGAVMWPAPAPKAPSTEKSYAKDFGERPKSEVGPTATAVVGKPESGGTGLMLGCLVAMVALLLCIGLWAPPSFVGHFTVFVLACFVGWQLVWKVTPALHTPLMSITNAVSGIIILGGMLHLTSAGTSDADTGSTHTTAVILGAVAVFFATINITGGFLVTRRMLAMFRK
jgi:NAD(P) transhydrogenase subunit alpha